MFELAFDSGLLRNTVKAPQRAPLLRLPATSAKGDIKAPRNKNQAGQGLGQPQTPPNAQLFKKRETRTDGRGGKRQRIGESHGEGPTASPIGAIALHEREMTVTRICRQ